MNNVPFSIEAYHAANNKQIAEFLQIEQAQNEFNAIPSYAERFKDAAQQEQANDRREFRGDVCDSCNHLICTCGDD